MLCAANGFLFRLVEDSFDVGLLGTQQMEYDSGKFVGRGCNCLRPAEFAGDAAEEFTQIVLGVVERLSAHAQGRRYAASDASAFGEQHLAATNRLLRAEP